MLRFAVKALISVTFYVMFVSAQNFSGRIINKDNAGLADVNLFVEYKNIGTITDSLGYFILTNEFEEGDTVLISSMGYAAQKYILNTDSKTLNITLRDTTLQFQKLVLTAQKNELYTDLSEKHVKVTDLLQQRDNATAFRALSGISVRSYGGPGGLSTLSLDGGQASNTRVLISGYNISNSQNGEMDISQLPLPFIDMLTLQTGGLGSFGSGAVDGVVTINPWQDKNKMSISLATFDAYSGYISTGMSKKSLSINLLGGFRREEGNYSYLWRDVEYIRKNNYFYQNYIASHINYILNTQSSLSGLFLLSSQERGIPGLKWGTLDTLSNRHDSIMLTGASYSYNLAAHRIRIKMEHKQTYDHFQNPYIFINSKHQTSLSSIRLTDIISVSEKISLNLSTSFDRDEITSENTHSHIRYTGSSGFKIMFKQGDFSLEPGVYHHFSPNLYRNTNFDFQISQHFSNIYLNDVKVYYGQLFRFPSFNDLYWEPGGNPDLKAENTNAYILALHFLTTSNFPVIFEYFYKQSTDLIQWIPQQSYWHPVNIQSVLRQGVKISTSWRLLNGKLISRIQYNYVDSENLTEGTYNGLELRYTPQHTFSLNVDYTYKDYHFNISTHYLGRQLAAYGFPEHSYLNSHLLTHIAVSKSIPFSTILTDIIINIQNASNEAYETISGYPEAGRQIKITVTFKRKET